MLAAIALAAVVQMDCLDKTCVAVQENGRVLVWGEYEPITQLKRDTPREVDGLDGVSKAQAGSRFFLALKRDGTVWSWGYNAYGVLGDHTGPGQMLRDTTTPVRVSGLSEVVDIEAGTGETAFAIKADGTLWAWGKADDGSLGVGVRDPAWRNMAHPQPFPMQVTGLPRVRQVSAGLYHALALLEDGRVVGWGSNQQGAVGDGTTESRWEPVEVKGLRDAVAVAAGFKVSLAVLKDGTVRVWGSNASGILLDGTREGFSAEPRPVAGITTGVDARAGGAFFLVRLRDNTLRCWGHSAWGACGEGKTGGYTMAVATPRNVSGVEWFGAGANSGFAKLSGGRIVGWGAVYVEPTASWKYHTPFAVELTPEGWARPDGRRPPA
jgi:alpha-tubulin suppressor-like RCC1 family protein